MLFTNEVLHLNRKLKWCLTNVDEFAQRIWGHSHKQKRQKKSNIQLHGLTHITSFVSIQADKYVHTYMRYVTYECMQGQIKLFGAPRH